MTNRLSVSRFSGLIINSLVLSFVVSLSSPGLAQAALFKVSPAVIDLKGQPREIVRSSVVLSNPSSQALSLYGSVYNVSSGGIQEFTDPAQADHSSSLANWILLPRNVIELGPGQQRTVDFSVEINLRAVPGIYHAVISYTSGPTREQAERHTASALTAQVNVEVVSDAKQRLELQKFAPAQKVFWHGMPQFVMAIRNAGNRATSAGGEIVLYNSAGAEIGSVPAQSQGDILPGQTQELQISGSKLKFGHYKALLRLEYGSGGASLQDTVYFWVLPWYMLLLILVILLSSALAAAYAAHSRALKQYEQSAKSKTNKRSLK